MRRTLEAPRCALRLFLRHVRLHRKMRKQQGVKLRRAGVVLDLQKKA